MASSGRDVGHLGSQVDVSPTLASFGSGVPIHLNETIVRLLYDILQVQKQQLELTRELVQLSRETHQMRQRQQMELGAWQQEHEGVVERCRDVLATLSQMHAGMLGDMADYINENTENLLESDFSISEFIDRFGPRLHHLSTMLAVFKQLSTPAGRPQEQRRG